MQKKVLAALMFSIFGIGTVQAKCAFAYVHGHCEYCFGNEYSRRATELGRTGCMPCSHAICEPNNNGPDSLDFWVKKEAKKIISNMSHSGLQLKDNKSIAMEIAKVNPHAAAAFVSLYMTYKISDVSIPEVATAWSYGDPIDSPLTYNKVVELINEYHNGERYYKEKYESKESGIRLRFDHEIRRTVDDGAYLNIMVSENDMEQREIKKILPNIKIKLRRIEDEQGGYWDAVGWEKN